jgi:hypothetical protein
MLVETTVEYRLRMSAVAQEELTINTAYGGFAGNSSCLSLY